MAVLDPGARAARVRVQLGIGAWLALGIAGLLALVLFLIALVAEVASSAAPLTSAGVNAYNQLRAGAASVQGGPGP